MTRGPSEPDRGSAKAARRVSPARILLPPLLVCFLVIGAPIWYLGARGYVERLVHPGADAGDKVVFYDWADFYGAGKLVALGRGSEIYDTAALGPEQRAILRLPNESQASMPFSNPPFVAAVFAPLTFLPAGVAIGLIGLAGIGLTAAAALALGRFVAPEHRRAALLIAFGFVALWPVGDSFALGQLSMFLVLAWLSFVAFEARGRDIAAGAALAVLFVKPQLAAVPALVALLTGRKRVVGGLLGAGAALALISATVSGPGFVVSYPASLLARAGWDHFEFGHEQHFYGWNGLVSLVAPYGSHPHLAVWGCLVVATLAGLTIAWRRGVRTGSSAFFHASAATLLCALLIDPHLLLHDLSLLALSPAFGYRAAQMEGQGERAWAWTAAGLWALLFVGPITQINIVTPGMACLFVVHAREAVRLAASESGRQEQVPALMASLPAA